MVCQKEISRINPVCILFMPDQSGSENEHIGNDCKRKKCDAVADAVNSLLRDFCLRCAKSETVRDYFHIGVLGYGASVGSAFGGKLSGKDIIPISEIAQNPLEVVERTKKVEDGAGGLVDESVKMPIWIRPVADGETPMCQAIAKAEKIVRDWMSQHPSTFPPIVLNITDGESTDGDPTSAANSLKTIFTGDENLLFFNAHVSSCKATPIEFPDGEDILPDKFAKLLFGMSSVLPEYMRSRAQEEGYQVAEQTRGFVFNADMVALVRFLEIGTRPGNL